MTDIDESAVLCIRAYVPLLWYQATVSAGGIFRWGDDKPLEAKHTNHGAPLLQPWVQATSNTHQTLAPKHGHVILKQHHRPVTQSATIINGDTRTAPRHIHQRRQVDIPT